MAAGAGLAGAVAVALLGMPAAAPIVEIVRVHDPLAHLAGLASIAAACALAAIIPALRASRIDPIATLRQD